MLCLVVDSGTDSTFSGTVAVKSVCSLIEKVKDKEKSTAPSIKTRKTSGCRKVYRNRVLKDIVLYVFLELERKLHSISLSKLMPFFICFLSLNF